jgi:MoCo/4Fe-4S cofactor protein with predicted Tat translocation signal
MNLTSTYKSNMEQKKYWQSFGELNKSDAYENSIQNEFAEDLPVEPGDGKLLDAKTPRRDFLKYLGFSTAAAMAAADGCRVISMNPSLVFSSFRLHVRWLQTSSIMSLDSSCCCSR